MTTSTDINNILIGVNGYIGCYSCNKLPSIKIVKKPVYIIVNTDTDDGEGEHWVSLILYKKKCLYFDSFGVKIINKYIIDWLLKLKYKNYIYSNVVIQPFYSDLCGLYVSCFILVIYKKYGYNYFLNLFNEYDLSVNDKIIFVILNNIVI